jgi:hypothetical protein
MYKVLPRYKNYDTLKYRIEFDVIFDSGYGRFEIATGVESKLMAEAIIRSHVAIRGQSFMNDLKPTVYNDEGVQIK